MSAVLVPFDGSSNSKRALRRAIEDARLTRSELHVVNVQPAPDDYAMVPAYLNRTRLRAFANERSRAVMRPAGELLRNARIKHELHIAHGAIAPSIVKSAKRLGCRTIVMGTRGHGTIASLLLGSVAREVMHLTKVPVLLVK